LIDFIRVKLLMNIPYCGQMQWLSKTMCRTYFTVKCARILWNLMASRTKFKMSRH